MPPQVQTQGQSQMQLNLQQSYQPLSQLNQMHWQHQQPQQQQPQNELNNGIIQFPVNSAVLPSSPKLHATEYLKPIKAPSPTNIDMSAIKSMSLSPTKNKRQSGSRSPNLMTLHQVKRGSGVDMKGPTPEVAQQLRFPWKLHLLLERCEYEHNHKLSSAANEGKNPGSVIDMPISWLPCGKAFKVHDKERFVKEIMPSFFGTQSFKTFQRNLNLWGFTRVSKGPQKDVCSHPLFLKGFPAVCQSMKRIVLKGTGRGNRAPLGGVDVSSVQAVVAAAAMQQAQQQHAAQQMNQVPHHNQPQQVLQQQHMQAQHKKSIDIQGQQRPLNHIHHQNQQQQNRQQQQQAAQNQQQQQFLIENGSIQAAPVPSQQKLVVLPSAPTPSPQYSTTTVMWPNNMNQQVQQQQQQTLNPADATANLQKSLQQLSTIIQQLNGCNAMATAAVNPNTVNNNNNGGNSSVNTANFQQQQQQLQVGPTPIMQQQQQPAMMQQQQQLQPAANMQNAVVAPSPMSTQDLVTLLLQRNLQQQIHTSTAQPQQPTAPQVQLQVPSSLFAPQSTLPVVPQQQQPANTTNFSQQSQMVQTPIQQGTMMGNFQPLQQQQTHQVSVSPSPSSPLTTGGQQQQQNQLLQLLLQQQGWATSATPAAI